MPSFGKVARIPSPSRSNATSPGPLRAAHTAASGSTCFPSNATEDRRINGAPALVFSEGGTMTKSRGAAAMGVGGGDCGGGDDASCVCFGGVCAVKGWNKERSKSVKRFASMVLVAGTGGNATTMMALATDRPVKMLARTSLERLCMGFVFTIIVYFHFSCKFDSKVIPDSHA